MANKCIVLDANIIIRAVLGEKAGIPIWTTDRIHLYLQEEILQPT